MFIEIKWWRIYKTSNNSINSLEWNTVLERWPFLDTESKILSTGKYSINEKTWLISLAEEIKEEKIKEQKAKEIGAKASLSDQLNLLADVCYILTEWMTEPKILEARKTLEDIREILNK